MPAPAAILDLVARFGEHIDAYKSGSYTEKMPGLHRQRAAAKTPHEQTALDRQISATDASIDREVYGLYGLTEDEIAIVEGREVIEDEAPSVRYPKSTDDDDSTAESYGAAAHHHGMILREDAPAYNTQPETKP